MSKANRISTNEPPYLGHRLNAHIKYGFASPFRIGISVGESGEALQNPYKNEKSRKNYADGVAVGEDRRRSKSNKGATNDKA